MYREAPTTQRKDSSPAVPGALMHCLTVWETMPIVDNGEQPHGRVYDNSFHNHLLARE